MSIFDNDIQEVLFSEEQLKNRVREIAQQITADYQGKEIMLISVLRGSFVFMADLCRAIDLLWQGHQVQRPGADHQGPV